MQIDEGPFVVNYVNQADDPSKTPARAGADSGLRITTGLVAPFRAPFIHLGEASAASDRRRATASASAWRVSCVGRWRAAPFTTPHDSVRRSTLPRPGAGIERKTRPRPPCRAERGRPGARTRLA